MPKLKLREERRKRKERYSGQRENLKKEYLRENGSLWGYKKTDEFKRISRNENRSFKRLEDKVTKERLEINLRDSEVINSNEMFFLMSKDSDEGTVLSAFNEAEQSGVPAMVIFKDYFGRKTIKKTSHSIRKEMFSFTRNLGKVRNDLLKKARKENVEVSPSDVIPKFDTSVISKDGKEFIVVDAYNTNSFLRNQWNIKPRKKGK